MDIQLPLQDDDGTELTGLTKLTVVTTLLSPPAQACGAAKRTRVEAGFEAPAPQWSGQQRCRGPAL
jgi:hypothetical protein